MRSNIRNTNIKPTTSKTRKIIGYKKCKSLERGILSIIELYKSIIFYYHQKKIKTVKRPIKPITEKVIKIQDKKSIIVFSPYTKQEKEQLKQLKSYQIKHK